jgi:2-dehydropantoate 2-reductase
MKKPTLLTIGTGALGGYYAGILQRGGMALTMLARSDYQKIKKDGVQVKSWKEDFTYHPTHVIQSTSELSDFPDYIAVFLKVLPQIDPIEIIKGAVGPKTTILLVQNGTQIEQPIQKAFPNNEVIGAIAFICCQRLAPGVIDHQDFGHLKIGTFPNKITDQTKELQHCFQKGGEKCEITKNIVAARWEKLVWNAPFNSISAILGGVDTKFMLSDPECYKLCQNIMKEVIAIAHADQNPIPENIDEKLLDYTQKMVPYKTSMALDFLAKRPLEVEAILGNAIQRARELQVAIPHLEATYALLRQTDRKNHNS